MSNMSVLGAAAKHKRNSQNNGFNDNHSYIAKPIYVGNYLMELNVFRLVGITNQLHATIRAYRLDKLCILGFGALGDVNIFKELNFEQK